MRTAQVNYSLILGGYTLYLQIMALTWSFGVFWKLKVTTVLQYKNIYGPFWDMSM